MSDYTEKNSNLIPKIDIPCFAWNSQAEQGLLFFKAKSLEVRVGKEIGAFSLELDGIFLENVFQAAKQYENGGPYLDLLNVSPKQAKRDERHCNSGKLVGFVRNDEIWTLEPKTAFYDYIYISALIKNFGYDLNISEYQWFTDIEFNPQKSINCQARAVAIYVALQKTALFNSLKSKDSWITFHERHVKG